MMGRYLVELRQMYSIKSRRKWFKRSQPSTPEQDCAYIRAFDTRTKLERARRGSSKP
jgi:hypothetical protein